MASRIQDLTGRTYGRLTVITRAHNTKGGLPQWLCKCECGEETIVRGDYLRSGITKSCGCYRKERVRENRTTHGQYRTKLYRVWARMKTRCLLETADNYESYGGRGITICDEWREDFQNFFDWAMSHGYKEGLTIDRIDNDGNYEPANCRWATHKQQGNNTRKTIHLTIGEETHTISEWADITGLDRGTIYRRFKSCWPTDKILQGAGYAC